MPIRFTRTVPIFRIFSQEKAKEFYLGFLASTSTGTSGSTPTRRSTCRFRARE